MTHDARNSPGVPVVALDVDGVLFPWLRPDIGAALDSLTDRCHLVWATSWEDDANRHIGPALGLPTLPVIRFPLLAKLDPIRAWVGGRPLAWIDDFIPPDAEEWAATRGAPTLLLRVDAASGLQPSDVDRLAAWLTRVTPSLSPLAP